MIDHFDILSIKADRSENPLQLYWAGPEGPNELHVFAHLSEWKDFISNLSLNCKAPLFVKNKFERAQYLYLLAWVYQDVIKAGELAAIVTLELALRDVYWNAYKKQNPKDKINAFLFKGLKYMVEHDELTDEKLPIFQKSGGVVVSNFYRDGKDQTGMLVGIRNSLAHGDPFDAMSYGSLLEIVRDLIDYMYRNFPEYP